jgi:hypothetical protein
MAEGRGMCVPAGGAKCAGVRLACPHHMMFVPGVGGVVICVSHCVCSVCVCVCVCVQGVYLPVSPVVWCVVCLGSSSHPLILHPETGPWKLI